MSDRGYSIEVRTQILGLYKNGTTASSLSLSYGIHESTILSWALKGGIKMKKSQVIINLDDETWHSIDGYESLYEISNKGRVKTLPRKGNKYTAKIITNKKSGNGYHFVILCKEGVKSGFFVHTLLGQKFVPNPLNLAEINHKNGNKIDNRIDNLEWVTHQRNIQHAYSMGLVNHGKLGDNAKSKRVGSFTEGGNLIKEYSCAQEARLDGFSPSNIYSRLLTGKPHKGYYWKYI